MARGDRYVSETPCKHCEGVERYVSNRKCCSCNTQFKKREIEDSCDQCGCIYKRLECKNHKRFCSAQCKERWRNENTDYQSTKEVRYAERESRREFIREYKMERGCEWCGYNKHPSALHMDHIDPSLKKYTLSQCISRSWKALEEELPKCRVLCANCHAIHTYNQYHSGIFHKGGNNGISEGLPAREKNSNS